MKKNPYQVAASYRDHAVTTASPARIVVLAFERLTLDLERALAALDAGEHPHTHLIHAQELLMALLSGLDTNAWEHAHRLGTIYLSVHQSLIKANIEKNPLIIRENLEIIVGLKDAWTQAERTAGDLSATRPMRVVDA
jgi:flagellar protein FliS